MGHPIEDSQTEQIDELIDIVLEEKLLENEDARIARMLHEEELHRQGPRTRGANASSTKRVKVEPKVSKGRKITATGFNKPMVLSSALGKVVGGEELVRAILNLMIDQI